MKFFYRSGSMSSTHVFKLTRKTECGTAQFNRVSHTPLKPNSSRTPSLAPRLVQLARYSWPHAPKRTAVNLVDQDTRIDPTLTPLTTTTIYSRPSHPPLHYLEPHITTLFIRPYLGSLDPRSSTKYPKSLNNQHAPVPSHRFSAAKATSPSPRRSTDKPDPPFRHSQNHPSNIPPPRPLSAP